MRDMWTSLCFSPYSGLLPQLFFMDIDDYNTAASTTHTGLKFHYLCCQFVIYSFTWPISSILVMDIFLSGQANNKHSLQVHRHSVSHAFLHFELLLPFQHSGQWEESKDRDQLIIYRLRLFSERAEGNAEGQGLLFFLHLSHNVPSWTEQARIPLFLASTPPGSALNGASFANSANSNKIPPPGAYSPRLSAFQMVCSLCDSH